MNSVLVALIVHLVGNTASLEAGRVPFYVVPKQVFAVDGDVPLKLGTSETFGPEQERRWRGLIAASGSVKNAAELCYHAAYRDLATGVGAMKGEERTDVLLQGGGNHGLAVAGVRWCNASLRRMDIVPLKHPEFAQAEKAVRQMGYEADVAYVAACGDAACRKTALKNFGSGVVGVGLEAGR